MSILQLPAELLWSIAGYMEPEDIEPFTLSCRTVFLTCKDQLQHHRQMKRDWRKIVIGYTPGAETALHFALAVARNPLIAKYVEDADMFGVQHSEDLDGSWQLHASLAKDASARAAITAFILQVPCFNSAEVSPIIIEWLDRSFSGSDSYYCDMISLLLLASMSRLKELNLPSGISNNEEDFAKIISLIYRQANVGSSLKIIRPYEDEGYDSKTSLQALLPFLEMESLEQMYLCSAIAVRDGYTGINFDWEHDQIMSRLVKIELASCCMDGGETSTLLSHTPHLISFRYSHETKWHGCQHDMDFGEFVAKIGECLGDTLIDLAVTIDELFGDVLTGVVSMKEFVALETTQLDVRIFDALPCSIDEDKNEVAIEDSDEDRVAGNDPPAWGREQIPDLMRVLPPSIRKATLYAKNADKAVLESLFNYSPLVAREALPKLEQIVLRRLDTEPLPSQVMASGAVVHDFDPHANHEPVWRACFRERFGA